MKLVIQWEESDDYTYSCNRLMCFHYSSIENFYFDCLAAIEQYIKNYEIYSKLEQKHWEKIRYYHNRLTRTVDAKRKQDISNQYGEWLTNNPKPLPPNPQFQLGDTTFHFEHFVKSSSGELVEAMPKIYSLEDWFDTHQGTVI